MNALVSKNNIFGRLFCYVSRHCLVLVRFGRGLIKNTNEVTQHVAGVILHVLEELIYAWWCGRRCWMVFQFKKKQNQKNSNQIQAYFAGALNKHY